MNPTTQFAKYKFITACKALLTNSEIQKDAIKYEALQTLIQELETGTPQTYKDEHLDVFLETKLGFGKTPLRQLIFDYVAYLPGNFITNLFQRDKTGKLAPRFIDEQIANIFKKIQENYTQFGGTQHQGISRGQSGDAIYINNVFLKEQTEKVNIQILKQGNVNIITKNGTRRADPEERDLIKNFLNFNFNANNNFNPQVALNFDILKTQASQQNTPNASNLIVKSTQSASQQACEILDEALSLISSGQKQRVGLTYSANLQQTLDYAKNPDKVIKGTNQARVVAYIQAILGNDNAKTFLMKTSKHPQSVETEINKARTRYQASLAGKFDIVCISTMLEGQSNKEAPDAQVSKDLSAAKSYAQAPSQHLIVWGNPGNPIAIAGGEAKLTMQRQAMREFIDSEILKPAKALANVNNNNNQNQNNVINIYSQPNLFSSNNNNNNALDFPELEVDESDDDFDNYSIENVLVSLDENQNNTFGNLTTDINNNNNNFMLEVDTFVNDSDEVEKVEFNNSQSIVVNNSAFFQYQQPYSSSQPTFSDQALVKLYSDAVWAIGGRGNQLPGNTNIGISGSTGCFYINNVKGFNYSLDNNGSLVAAPSNTMNYQPATRQQAQDFYLAVNDNADLCHALNAPAKLRK